jgi:hypothetical protein
LRLAASAALAAAGRLASGVVARWLRRPRWNEDLRHPDRRVDHGGDDEDGRAHGREWSRPAEPLPPGPGRAALLRPEVPGNRAHLERYPVPDHPEAVWNPQRQPGQRDIDPGDRHRHRPPVPDALPDLVQAVATGFNLLGRGMERPAERRLTSKDLVHASRSSTVRSVDIALAV